MGRSAFRSRTAECVPLPFLRLRARSEKPLASTERPDAPLPPTELSSERAGGGMGANHADSRQPPAARFRDSKGAATFQRHADRPRPVAFQQLQISHCKLQIDGTNQLRSRKEVTRKSWTRISPNARAASIRGAAIFLSLIFLSSIVRIGPRGFAD